jgi:hypothetical protein
MVIILTNLIRVILDNRPINQSFPNSFPEMMKILLLRKKPTKIKGKNKNWKTWKSALQIKLENKLESIKEMKNKRK